MSQQDSTFPYGGQHTAGNSQTKPSLPGKIFTYFTLIINMTLRTPVCPKVFAYYLNILQARDGFLKTSIAESAKLLLLKILLNHIKISKN